MLRIGSVRIYYAAMFSIVIKCKHLQMYNLGICVGASVSSIAADDAKKRKLKTLSLSSLWMFTSFELEGFYLK